MADTSFRVQQIMESPVREVPAQASRRLHTLLFVLFLTGALALSIRGWQFYRLSIGERVDHPDFRVLGPGSNLGQGYGIAGTLLILTNLLYLVRRRFPRLSVGSLRSWLDVHVFTGLFGAMLVTFHSAFQVRNSIAIVTVTSLSIVVVTGVLGRYLYSLAPKPDLQRLRELLLSLDAVGPGLGQLLRQQIALVPGTPPPARPSLLGALAKLPSYRREARQRRAVIAQVVAHFAQHFGPELALLDRPLAECTRIFTAEVRAAAARAVLDSWRGLHRFAALLMVLLVALHIGVAWYYGFVWVFTK